MFTYWLHHCRFYCSSFKQNYKINNRKFIHAYKSGRANYIAWTSQSQSVHMCPIDCGSTVYVLVVEKNEI